MCSSWVYCVRCLLPGGRRGWPEPVGRGRARAPPRWERGRAREWRRNCARHGLALAWQISRWPLPRLCRVVAKDARLGGLVPSPPALCPSPSLSSDPQHLWRPVRGGTGWGRVLHGHPHWHSFLSVTPLPAFHDTCSPPYNPTHTARGRKPLLSPLPISHGSLYPLLSPQSYMQSSSFQFILRILNTNVDGRRSE